MVTQASNFLSPNGRAKVLAQPAVSPAALSCADPSQWGSPVGAQGIASPVLAVQCLALVGAVEGCN